MMSSRRGARQARGGDLDSRLMPLDPTSPAFIALLMFGVFLMTGGWVALNRRCYG